ncbi:MAG TPA: VWA domain-containing protein [Streptosporangiaceae bacterium]|jgi:hypothetical protein
MTDAGLADPVTVDVAAVSAEFGAALYEAGVPADPGRCERFARAVSVLRPRTLRELHACGLATLVSGPEQIEIYDRIFAAAFGARLGLPVPGAAAPPGSGAGPQPDGSPPQPANGAPAGPPRDMRRGEGQAPEGDESLPWRTVATAAERLSSRDFADLSEAELSQLEELMRRRVLATPPRRSRRQRPASGGRRPDLRATLRQARRTVGEPLQLAHRAPRLRPRRLVVLCDISGSMEPYARAMLQLLYCASQNGARRPAEVFTFATRLTRITDELATARPETVLAEAGAAAPDWSGGTRIGASIREFNDRYGAPGLARGAVVLIISDGWETGDATELGEQMARLHRLAYRIIWANPRTKSPRYEPKVSGMAAAWPHCDAVVSAHSLDAIGDLITALAQPA